MADRPTAAAALAAGRLTLTAAHAAAGDAAAARGYLALVRWGRVPLRRGPRGRWPERAEDETQRGWTYWFNHDSVWFDYVTKRPTSVSHRRGQGAYVLSASWIRNADGDAEDIYADTAAAADLEAVRRFAAMPPAVQCAHLSGVYHETEMPKQFELAGGHALEVGLVDAATPAAAWVCLGVCRPTGRWQPEPEPVVVSFLEAGETALLVAVARGCLAAGHPDPLLDILQEHAHLWPADTADRLTNYLAAVAEASSAVTRVRH